jgi:lysyl-tRNA synthetase class 2
VGRGGHRLCGGSQVKCLPMSEERSIREIRLEKLERMKELGHDPYLVERFDRTAGATELLSRYQELEGKPISFAGRLVSYRLMGKAGFAHISDGDSKIQAYFKKDDLGETGWELYNLLDIGDHVGVQGELFTTKTGEKTIHVRELTPLSKSLDILPLGKEKEGQHWYGLTDVEQRYRHRHLDLICNAEARQILINRAKIVSAVRRFFDSKGFLEVETPLLQTVAGGAAAKPFVTHYNAYDMDVKLRISLELYLKRLICGDLPKVYEIGRVFRNEGVSNRHNPEFSLLEWYEAYVNLEDVMQTVEDLFRFVALEVFGSTVVTIQPDVNDSLSGEHAETRSQEIDFGKPWRRVNLLQEIERFSGITADELRELATAKKAMERVGLPSEKENNLGGIIEKLLERFVEPTLQDPAFVIGYPIETSPLAKKDPNNPRFTRRFEGYVRGREMCNAFSEINDPLDQLQRFEQQQQELSKGDEEAHPMDQEFLYALEGGMPPTGGCGIGMERMAMALTGADHIREIILFPMMKPVE